eukprot:TRINITY_DN10834_c0_g1_i2.p1 TRINITY_DN10834_c0_g1~~TRINITY_DN10834_c0_g1_i2.p1  ORF type:complete len:239 (+),score=34.79 TRINITY_DN10834_c0_g1_i2:362-1078(+)
MTFVGILSVIAQLANGTVLLWFNFQCCYWVWGLDICMVNQLSWIQLLAQVVGFYPIHFLLIVWNPHDKQKERRDYFGNIVLFWVLTFLLALTIGLTAIFLVVVGPYSKASIIYAYTMGGISAVAMIIQWVPQIVITVVRKDPGSLSIPMLCIQAPGSLVLAFYQLFAQNVGVTTWLPFVLNGVLGFVLLIICFVFYCRRCRKAKGTEALIPPEHEPVEMAEKPPSDAQLHGQLLTDTS